MCGDDFYVFNGICLLVYLHFGRYKEVCEEGSHCKPRKGMLIMRMCACMENPPHGERPPSPYNLIHLLNLCASLGLVCLALYSVMFIILL